MLKNYNFILSQRANILLNIRNFFLQHNIIEVETPILTKYTVTDYNLIPFYISNDHNFLNYCSKMWLITSPEYHMKRLLSCGIGPIYQICHVFRNEEIGDLHNLEFTMLEWYQPFYNMFDMMEIIENLIISIFKVQFCKRISYRNVFIENVSIDPINTSIKELCIFLEKIDHKHLIKKKNTIIDLLNIIFLIAIQPKLGFREPLFVYHYPASQAMLARINKHNVNFSDRFELFFKGIELGNGFCELIDSVEQRERFNLDNSIQRKDLKRLIDTRFLDALDQKFMPYCSGIALGIDRIVMLICNLHKIKYVLTFSSKDC